MSIFTAEHHKAMEAFHYVYKDVADAIEHGTNNPEFAIGMLKAMLAMAEENHKAEVDAFRKLAKHLDKEAS